MPRSNRKSWRLKFIDLESGFSITDNSTPVSGYIVCRAPKGETRAMYFGPQNSQAIDAMIGLASANWPDIVEAQTFNSEYGLYISAPPGSSASYPSHLGGFYIASNGVYKFYNVTSKEELQPSDDGSTPPYKVSVHPGSEKDFDFTVSPSTVEIVVKTDDLAKDASEGVYSLLKGDVPQLVVRGVHSKILNRVFQIDYDDTTDLAVGLTKTTKWDSLENKFVPDDTFPLQGVSMVAQADNPNLYDITFADFDIEKFLGPVAYDEFIKSDESGNNTSKLFELFRTGFAKTAAGNKYQLGFALTDLIHIVVNIQDEVYAFVMQKSLTEKQTDIVISDIGYDKYRYDDVFDYAKVADWESLPVPTDLSPERLALYVEGVGGPTIKLFTCMGSEGRMQQYVENTDEFSTQYITFSHPHDFDETDDIAEMENKDMYHKIWYCDDGKLKHVLTEEECITQEDGNEQRGLALYQSGMTASPPTVAIKDPYANTFTFSCTEEVYPGVVTNGGSFTGSLDENGTDTYGSNIYFPNVLSDDDFSFVEVRVIKKFGDETGDWDNGFWTHKRAVDEFDLDMYSGEVPQLTFTIEGDRYTELLMTMNLVEGKTGGIWRSEHAAILKEGLTEALNGDYDDSWVFMEPSGYDNLKPNLATIRKAQDFATVISPYQIPTSAISNGVITPTGAQKLVVSSRYRGVSTWCGEFEVFDDVTFKKFWRKPIGDVGLMLARIMDEKLGAWAPAWTNVGNLGGQLKSVVLRSKFGYDDSSIEDKLKVTYILDQKGINPISYTSDYGLMMLSSKTTEDPNNINNWSFLEAQMSFDCVKREIRDNVMIPQIKKPINKYYMGIRQMQVDAILAKRLSGQQPLWYEATCDIEGVNNDTTIKQRKFCIKVFVKPTVFAETVELTLETSI
jgi:hypothetical protein